ncbi:type II toxin-antitoxin system VapC family toxin [bacterium]|nr:type II toxin-antitoxin system VapC family toxin [bacterium]
MYLVDTNIFLEGFLEQEKMSEVKTFFQNINLNEMFITDLALHSIGIILYRLGKNKLFTTFINDMVINGMRIVSLTPEDLVLLGKNVKEYNLSFDDAYQYYATKKYDLKLVSFDNDFDKTDIKREEPGKIINAIT